MFHAINSLREKNGVPRNKNTITSCTGAIPAAVALVTDKKYHLEPEVCVLWGPFSVESGEPAETHF